MGAGELCGVASPALDYVWGLYGQGLEEDWAEAPCGTSGKNPSCSLLPLPLPTSLSPTGMCSCCAPYQRLASSSSASSGSNPLSTALGLWGAGVVGRGTGPLRWYSCVAGCRVSQRPADKEIKRAAFLPKLPVAYWPLGEADLGSGGAEAGISGLRGAR